MQARYRTSVKVTSGSKGILDKEKKGLYDL